ncbi:MAG TPA: transporter substrate-binding domain-containing protein [Burkholderiaceae bacterium]|nr:transporter substrate-binding domain-containing protein [Burkholderiaceae bacterium]
MARNRRFAFLGLAGLLGLAPCVHAGPITIAAIDIPGLLEPSQNGTYDRVLARIAEMAGEKWQLNYLPAKRVNAVLTAEGSCAIPYDLHHFNEISAESKGALIASLPINVAKVYLFTAPDSVPLGDIPDKSHFVVGVRRGLPYGQDVDRLLVSHPERFLVANSEESNIRMLLSGGINAMLAFLPDINHYYQTHPGTPALVFDKEKPIVVYKDSIVCGNTPENSHLIDQINNGLTQMRSSGELKKILGQNYIQP